MSASSRRSGSPLLLALVAAFGLLRPALVVTPADAEVHAATPDLTIVSDARYDGPARRSSASG